MAGAEDERVRMGSTGSTNTSSWPAADQAIVISGVLPQIEAEALGFPV